jgi:hypothetical protein
MAIARKLAVIVVLTAGLAGRVTFVEATEQWHSSTLRWVYPLGNGDFVIGFDVDSAACTGVGAPKYMYVAVGQNGVTEEGIKKLYAAALTAFSLGKTLSIAFDDATAYCYVNRFSVHK